MQDEAVGYLTSTDYKNPAFVVTPSGPSDCADDIKDVYRAICHDITRGGNSKCVGAGNSYYSGGALQHITGNDSNGYSVKEATIEAINYSVGIARSCINNITWNGGYQSTYTQVKDESIQLDGGSYDIGNCANVLSAVTVCAGIVTTIIDVGSCSIRNHYKLSMEIMEQLLLVFLLHLQVHYKEPVLLLKVLM